MATSTATTTTSEDSSSVDLWSQILLSVQTAKSTPLCPVILLGEPETGKSTLLRGLAEGCPSGYIEPETNGDAAESTRGKRDLALAYGYCDVPDDEGEDTLARLSLYTLYSSTHESLLASLPHTSTPLATLRDSLFVITLDWTRPQTFLEELRNWIAVIRDTLRHARRISEEAASDEKGKRRIEAVVDEMREAVELYIRSYTPPGSTAAAPSSSSTTDDTPAPSIVPLKAPALSSLTASEPLEEGVLDENLGVSIVVVLTKSDTLSSLERNRNFKEEQFDYIQQVLRTICLKYGAALFSVAQNRPASYDVVRQYLVHRAQRIPFNHAASTIDRDVLLVPAGWDTWGKITALRDDFSPASTARGWEWDCRVVERQRAKGLDTAEAERELQVEDGAGDDSSALPLSACRLWEDVIGDDWAAGERGKRSLGAGKDSATAGATTGVPPPDAQAFLSQHYTALQRDTSTSDPRAKLSGTARPSTPGRAGSSDAVDTARPSIVGPMQSTGLSGPNVERAMARGAALDDDGMSGSASGIASSSSTVTAASTSTNAPPATASSSSRPKTSRRESRGPGTPTPGDRAGSPSGNSATSPGAGATKQSEVLQSFFQDLLRGKGGGGGSGSGGGSASGAPSSSAARRAAVGEAARRDESQQQSRSSRS